MDGIDGLCASQAMFLLIVYSLLFSLNADVIYKSYCIILSLSLLGFLFFNFPQPSYLWGMWAAPPWG